MKGIVPATAGLLAWGAASPCYRVANELLPSGIRIHMLAPAPRIRFLPSGRIWAGDLVPGRNSRGAIISPIRWRYGNLNGNPDQYLTPVSSPVDLARDSSVYLARGCFIFAFSVISSAYVVMVRAEDMAETLAPDRVGAWDFDSPGSLLILADYLEDRGETERPEFLRKIYA